MRASLPPAESPGTAAPGPSRGSSTRRPRASFVLALLLAWAPPLTAQSTETTTEPGWLRQWTDVRDDLRSSDVATRVRAIERLGASREARSRVALVEAVKEAAADPEEAPPPRDAATDSPAHVDLGAQGRARVRLALARALARHASHLEVRRGLARLMTSAADGAEPHDGMALHTAALALSLSGTPDALRALARALWQSPSLAEAARQATLAHPPARLEPLLDGTPTDASIALLGELGDQRAYEHLREIVLAAPPPRAALAAWALFRLGIPETQELARHWWRKSADATQRYVATRILVETGDALASDAMTAHLTELPNVRAQRRSLLELAASRPDPSWEAALLRLARSALSTTAAHGTTEEDDLVLLALAKLDRTTSLRHLMRGLDGPAAHAVAGALARTDGPRASALLSNALERPARRRWALRALGVRLARGSAREHRAALEGVAARLLRAPRGGDSAVDATDRAAAAWALAAAHPAKAAELVPDADAVLLRALGRQASTEALARTATERLLRLEENAQGDGADDPTARLALYPALRIPAAASRIPTRTLASLLPGAEAAAPLVVELLTARTTRRVGFLSASDDPMREPRGWLASTDAPTRAAAARGLGTAGPSAAVALLSEALSWDPEPSVRRAAAWALSRRPELVRRRALESAAQLDPDPLVRTLARLGLAASDAAAPDAASDALLWERAEQPVQLFSALGEAFLLFPDPDGFVGVHGAIPEPWELRRLPVANPASQGEARPRR